MGRKKVQAEHGPATGVAAGQMQMTTDPGVMQAVLAQGSGEGMEKLAALNERHAKAALMPRWRPIDCIRAAFTNARRDITLSQFMNPETGEPLVLYFTPLTLGDLEWAAIGAPENETHQQRSLRLLCQKAQIKVVTAAGEERYLPAFVEADIPVLKKEAFFDDIQRLVEHMYAAGVTARDAEQVLADPQTDGSAGSST